MSRARVMAAIESDAGLARVHAFARERLDDDPGHDLEHHLRVAAWALRIAGDHLSREVVAAALLHDVVNVPKNSPHRATASEKSAEVARALLPDCGFDEAAIGRIAAAIEDHSYSRGASPRSPLGCALQDADRLEALGAIGIMRTFSTGARMGARYFHDDDPWAVTRALDDKAFSIDHFFKELLRVQDGMTTEIGRTEARRRTEVLVAFLRALGDELERPLTRDDG